MNNSSSSNPFGLTFPNGPVIVLNKSMIEWGATNTTIDFMHGNLIMAGGENDLVNLYGPGNSVTFTNIGPAGKIPDGSNTPTGDILDFGRSAYDTTVNLVGSNTHLTVLDGATDPKVLFTYTGAAKLVADGQGGSFLEGFGGKGLGNAGNGLAHFINFTPTAAELRQVG